MTNTQWSTSSLENVNDIRCELLLEGIRGHDIQCRVLPNHRMGAGSRLDRFDSAWINQPTSPQTLGILLRYEIICDDRKLHAASIENGDELLNQRRFSRSDRATNSHARSTWTVSERQLAHLNMYR